MKKTKKEKKKEKNKGREFGFGEVAPPPLPPPPLPKLETSLGFGFAPPPFPSPEGPFFVIFQKIFGGLSWEGGRVATLPNPNPSAASSALAWDVRLDGCRIRGSAYHQEGGMHSFLVTPQESMWTHEGPC